MEALVALGLACNILQLISFGRETISLVTRISKDGSTDINLAKDAQRIEQLSNELETAMSNQSNIVSPKYQELLVIARDCKATAKDIKAEMDSLSASSWGKFGKIVKGLRQKSTLERLEKTLLLHQNTLQSRLLTEM
jgi:hypothetical protein